MILIVSVTSDDVGQIHTLEKQTEQFFMSLQNYNFENISREIEVCQNNANKSDNFSRQIEVCQSNENKSDKNFFHFTTS